MTLAVQERTGIARSGGVDAAALLTAYVCLLWFIPSPMVVNALGSAGSPATLFGIGIFLYWAWHTVRRSEPSDGRARPVRAAMLGLVLVLLVAYAHAMAGPLPGDEISTADSGLLRLISLAGVVLLACDGISDFDRLVVLLRRLAFAAGLVALLGLAQYVTGELFVDRIRIPGLTAGTEGWSLGTRSGRIRPSGTSMSPIEYGVVLGMALPLVTVCASVQSRYRWLFRAMLVAMIASIFFSMSRSAYICALAGAVVLALSWNLQQRLRALGFLAVVSTVLYVTVPGLLGAIQGLFSNADQDPSISSRTGSYDIAGAFIAESPLVGKGFGTFLPKYWILDNAYLGMTIEAGLLGLLSLLALIICGLVSARTARRTLQLEGGREEHAQYAQAVLASVAAGGFGLAFFDAFAFPQTAGCLFLFIGLAGAMRRITQESVRSR
ncbi:O-antigen ligase family protein [uncultured Nocardioides sp.]|uniref:O-antigen ligase family protein n=1 Tax=Nocardioides sp. T5 TaxID=3400182 RepID=UPI00260F3687|nr:O-antigen ligase family protein [uncultured Nocardioides sp.]